MCHKLKMIFLSSICLIWALLSTTAFANSNQENSFQDFHWDDSLKEIQTKYNNGLFIHDKDITTYLIPMHTLELDGIKTLPNIALYFCDDKLFEVFTVFDDKTLAESDLKYEKLLHILTNKYGKPTITQDFYSLNLQMAVWNKSDTTLILYHNEKQSEFLGDKIYTNILVMQNPKIGELTNETLANP